MIGVVVVTYNSEDVIGRCLDACLAIAGAQVIVVDNASSDATRAEVEKRPAVRLIANRMNRGFAGAANQGIAACDCDFALLLNPDVVLKKGVDALLAACSRPGVGAASGCLIDVDGRPQHGFAVRAFPTPATLAFEVLGVNRLWPSNPVNRAYRLPAPEEPEPDVPQPAGAMLMIRSSAWQKIGGFDESFLPIWFEDVDFCLRLHAAGYAITYVPQAVAEHAGGHSAAKIGWTSRQQFWYGSLLKYASKHYSTPGRAFVCLSVGLACIPRMIFRCVTHRTLVPVSVYSKVMWLSGICLMRSHCGVKGDPRGLAVEPETNNFTVS